MPEQMRDDEAFRSLAKKPDYGKNDFDQERKDCNPLDMAEDGVAGDCQEDADQQIDGRPDRPGDDYD